MAYLSWNQQTIADFSEEAIEAMYDQGFVFTRRGKGAMDQTRSVRIDLNTFEPTSENRRILNINKNLSISPANIPYVGYHWSIGKTAQDFYLAKFGKRIFSANKIKELLTNRELSNFNTLIKYQDIDTGYKGYAICYENNFILHYSYPFYTGDATVPHTPSIGMGMMLKAIEYAKNKGKKYIYLGSAQRPTDTYKLQFKGVEWFDGSIWQDDMDMLKKILKDQL